MTSLTHKICSFFLQNCTFFLILQVNSSAVFTLGFLILNVKCGESNSQKDITDVLSFQLHVDIEIKYILNHFLLLQIMIIESTCLRVKDLDLYIIETACKFIKISVTLLFKYKKFLFN